MSVETEMKIEVSAAELREIRDELERLQARTLFESQAEENLLFDFPDRRLARSGCALRLRRYGGWNILTFKGAVQKDPHFKKREELESKFEDFEIVRKILEQLGLQVCFQYAKRRAQYLLEVGEESVQICLDETPVGSFVEVEGSTEAIHQVARKFDWSPDRYVKRTYVELYRERGS